MIKTKKKSAASEIAFEEGGKSQSKIGDIRQILKIVKLKIASEVIAYKEGETSEMPFTKEIFSEALKAIEKANK